MGGDLYRMIRDGAPETWSPLMRLVAETIADAARDPRQGPPGDGGWPWSNIPIRGSRSKNGKWHDGLTERTGMSPRAISRILTDLARADYEMRERIGTDKRGRPVFAYPGRATRFRVPLLKPRDPPPDSATTCSPDTATIPAPEVGTDGRRNRRRRSPESASRRSPDSATPISQVTPKETPSPHSQVVNRSLEGVRDGQTDDDLEAERKRQIDRIGEWIREHPESTP
jgi:hypothetical protein